MDNDKLFAAYTLTLIAGAGAMIVFAMSANFAMAPSPLAFIEHLLLGFAIRGAYKAADGFYVSDWIPSFRTVAAPSVPTLEPAIAEDFNDDERLAA